MIELRPIDGDNFGKIIGLELEEGQEQFVATNLYTLAEAYVALTTGEFEPLPYAIYDGEAIVGFIGMAYVPPGSPSSSGRDQGGYEMYRFMIDKHHQGKGLGRAALTAAIELLKTKPSGPATHVETSFVPGNDVARRLYTSLGFVETGKADEDGELIAVMPL